MKVNSNQINQFYASSQCQSHKLPHI